MTGYIKLGMVAAALALAFGGGYRYAAALYSKDMADYKAAQTAAAQQQEAAFRAKEQENAKRLVEALDERDRALASATDLSGDLERLRQSARRAANSGKMSGPCSSAVKPYQQRLASCTDLLLESAQLLREGADLARRAAINKDTIQKAVAPSDLP